MEVDTKSLLLVNLMLFYMLGISANVEIDACAKLTSCSCETSQGVIDLSPLALTGGAPKFKDQQDAGGSYYYSWNPCNPFTEDPTNCKNVMGCQTDMSNYYNLGTPDSAKFIVDTTRGLILQYSATTDATRTLDVILVCDQSQEASLTVKGEDPPGSAIYEMMLTSKYACPGTGGGGGGTITLSLTAGSVIVIIFFVVVIVYFLAGVMFQKFVRKASGRELAPNGAFWGGLPGLIKDGVMFTFTCGKRSSYSNI